MEYEYIMQLLANQTIFNITCIVFIISNIIWISKQFLFLGWKVIQKIIQDKYISCLEGKNIEQIQHAKELIDASLEATTFWGILFTLFNAILSKVVSLIAGMYADALFDSEPKAATNIENLLLLAFLVFTLFFIYKSMNAFQKEKYFFNILQEQLGKLKESDYSINIVNNIEVEQGIVNGESKKKKKKHKHKR